jgi:hypothetical protein
LIVGAGVAEGRLGGQARHEAAAAVLGPESVEQDVPGGSVEPQVPPWRETLTVLPGFGEDFGDDVIDGRVWNASAHVRPQRRLVGHHQLPEPLLVLVSHVL